LSWAAAALPYGISMIKPDKNGKCFYGKQKAPASRPSALTQLPAEEQEACRKFWAEVEELRKKAGFPKETP
jgi:hypothetical protein